MRLILDNIIFQLQKVGGISIYWKEIIKRALHDTDIELQFIAAPDGIVNFIYNEIINEEPVIKDIERISPILNHRYLPIILPKIKTPFVYHSSYYRPIWNSKAKSVTTIHDFIYEKFDHGIKKDVHSLQKRLSVSNSDIVICISENTKKDLLDIYPQYKNKDIRVVYNGVSEGYYPIKSVDTIVEPYLLVVGNRVGCKNFDTTISAFVDKLSKDFKLKIVGKPLTEEEQLKFGPALSRVEVISNVPEKELNKLYNSAFALIFPSTYEGFGIPVIEAMKASCPVITTTCSCMKEVGGNAAVYMENVNAESIIKAVERLKKDCFRQETIDLGIKQSAKFSWDKTYASVKNIYDELNNM